MLKIRRPLGRLIFNMGIAIPGKTVFLIETAPRWAAENRMLDRVPESSPKGSISSDLKISVITMKPMVFVYVNCKLCHVNTVWHSRHKNATDTISWHIHKRPLLIHHYMPRVFFKRKDSLLFVKNTANIVIMTSLDLSYFCLIISRGILTRQNPPFGTCRAQIEWSTIDKQINVIT